MRFILIGILIFVLAEIALLMWIGNNIGVLLVLAFILLTAIAGILFGRKQGFETWNRAMNAMSRHEAPAREFIDGICIFLGAASLVAPGFISDVFGLLLLIPLTRNLFKRTIARMLDKMVNRGVVIYRRF